MLRLDFNLILNMINLVILFLLLKKFLFGPITGIMEKRQAMIDENIANAEKQKKEAGVLKQQYEDALSGAKDTSQEILAQAKTDAKAEYERIVGDADKQAGRIIKAARETVNLERDQVLRDMKTQAAVLAMDAAKKIVKEQCGEDNNRAVYEQFLKETGEPYDDKE